MNPAVSKLSGYTFEELIGRPISDFIIPDFRPLFQDEYLKEIKNKGRSEGGVIFQSKDEQEHFIEYRNVIVTPEGGEQYLKIFPDFPKEKEQLLHQSSIAIRTGIRRSCSVFSIRPSSYLSFFTTVTAEGRLSTNGYSGRDRPG